MAREKATQSERYTRVQVHFHPDDFKDLKKLQEKGGYRTITMMIRQALKLLKLYVEAIKDGYRLQLVKGDDVKEIILLE